MNEFPWGVCTILGSGLLFTVWCIYYILDPSCFVRIPLCSTMLAKFGIEPTLILVFGSHWQLMFSFGMLLSL